MLLCYHYLILLLNVAKLKVNVLISMQFMQRNDFWSNIGFSVKLEQKTSSVKITLRSLVQSGRSKWVKVDGPWSRRPKVSNWTLMIVQFFLFGPSTFSLLDHPLRSFCTVNFEPFGPSTFSRHDRLVFFLWTVHFLVLNRPLLVFWIVHFRR